MPVKNINVTVKSLPKYLYEYPNEEMYRRVKIASAMQGMTVKDFITEALIEKLVRSEEHERV